MTSNLKEMVGTEYRSFYSAKGRPHGVTNADKEVRKINLTTQLTHAHCVKFGF